MNKKTNNFNALSLFMFSVVLGTTLLTFNARGPEITTMESKMAAYLEKEDFAIRGHLRGHFITHLIATAKDYEFDPLLILAIMKVESSFNPNAISHRGAMGLLQIKPIAAREVAKVFDLFPVANHQLMNPFINLRIGVQYLSFLRQSIGKNKVRILSAYNMGPTHIKRFGIVSTGYSSKVMRAYREIIKLFS